MHTASSATTKPGTHMIERLFPCAYAESAFSIDYAKLYERGYRGIIFDVDNTLVAHGADSTPRVDAFLESVRESGFSIVLLSDNDTQRLERFTAENGLPYIPDANKPNPAGFEEAAKLLGLEKTQVVCVGDQVFTDILGANRAGIDSILVKYIGYYERGWKGKRRAAESMVLAIWRITRKRHRLHDIEIEGMAAT